MYGSLIFTPASGRFFSYLFSNHLYQGWKPVITVLIGSGMRIGECLGLRWEDLDFENRIIDINPPLEAHLLYQTL